MITIPGERTVYFDVDETLIKDGFDEQRPDARMVKVLAYGRETYVYENETGSRLVDIFKDRGYTVVVWTQSGPSWAEAVVKALGLERSVDLCISKPSRYVDDLDCVHWMGSRRDPEVLKPHA